MKRKQETKYLQTRSKGALRAPNSSFGPLDSLDQNSCSAQIQSAVAREMRMKAGLSFLLLKETTRENCH